MQHGGVELDPLIALDDLQKPLRSRLLAVPSLRARYIDHVREIAECNLNWNSLGPIVAAHRALIIDAVRADTRTLSPFEAFERATADSAATVAPAGDGRPSAAGSLRAFADTRRAFLLGHPALAPQIRDGDSGSTPEPDA